MKPAFFFACAADALGAARVRAGPAVAGDARHSNRTAPPPRELAANCAPMASAPPRGTDTPDGTTTGQASEPLGDKLAKSDGVLCPPSGVDPEMRAPTPDAGNMPVIPPPGSPGGDPTVRPK